jgi:DHA2 family multidrug resistance protein
VLLEEGQREQWFSSDLIRYMAMVSGFGFLCIAYGQIYARRPVIKLRLLADRQFGAVALMGIVLGMVLYGTSYVILSFWRPSRATTRISRARSCCSRGCPVWR